MAEQIKDGTGSNNYLTVNADGSINTQESEIPTSANNFELDLDYISSGTGTGLDTGSAIGSIVKHFDTGSYVKVLTYSNNNLTNVGSWV